MRSSSSTTSSMRRESPAASASVTCSSDSSEKAPSSARTSAAFELRAAAGDGLIQRRERIAHAAFAGLRQHGQRFGVGLDAFLPADPRHARGQVLETHRAKAEMLAARGDGGRDLVRLGGAEHEDHPRRRLLDGLEQRVEGLAGDLVGLVDDEDLVAVARRLVAHVFAQLAHLVDAAVGGRVDLDDVHRAARR